MAFDQSFKKDIIHKALNRGRLDLKTFCQRHNVGYSTVQTWLRDYKDTTNNCSPIPTSKVDFTAKIRHLLASSKLDEESLGAYCRKNGIYQQDLDKWQVELMSIDVKTERKQLRAEIKSLKEKNKNLQHELNRKDKALAEATAIVVLKKKAEELFGVPEDD
jgi:hypothetical protein